MFNYFDNFEKAALSLNLLNYSFVFEDEDDEYYFNRCITECNAYFDCEEKINALYKIIKEGENCEKIFTLFMSLPQSIEDADEALDALLKIENVINPNVSLLEKIRNIMSKRRAELD